MKMKFSEWHKLKEEMAPPYSNNTQGSEDNTLQAKHMLYYRLQQLFAELDKFKLTRNIKIDLLDSVLKELDMKRPDMMRVMRQQGIAQP